MASVSMTLLDNLLVQQKSYKHEEKTEADGDILRELNSCRLELESKKKLNLHDRNIK